MPTPLEKLQTLYSTTIDKLTEAFATIGPNITVGGVNVDRMGYIRELQSQLKGLREIPGVAPDQNPSFSISEFL
jgi:hypothetical protein